MTTNDAEALDPALLRPGRIDYKLYMGKAVAAQKTELYRRFFPAESVFEAEQFAQAHEAETMAEFQGLLLLRLEHGEQSPGPEAAQRQRNAFDQAARDAELLSAVDQVTRSPRSLSKAIVPPGEARSPFVWKLSARYKLNGLLTYRFAISDLGIKLYASRKTD